MRNDAFFLYSVVNRNTVVFFCFSALCSFAELTWNRLDTNRKKKKKQKQESRGRCTSVSELL